MFSTGVRFDDLIKLFNEKRNVDILTKEQFCDKLERQLCTDWYKDFNEFWSSECEMIKNDAWDLTKKKVFKEFCELRDEFADKIIFYAIKIGCIEDCKEICKIISNELHKRKMSEFLYKNLYKKKIPYELIEIITSHWSIYEDDQV